MSDILFERAYSTGDDISFLFYAVDTDTVVDGNWIALFSKSKYLTGDEFRQRNFRKTIEQLEIQYPPGWLPG